MVMVMLLSDMEQKDIIDLETGDNLGKIMDAEISVNGQIITFIAQPHHFFKRLFKSNSTEIAYKEIIKIGNDVILVKRKTEDIKV
jgi:YlmC/YmxH family sporulation protein